MIQLLVKLKITFFIAVLVSPIAWLLEKITEWQVDNGTYASLVLGAVAVDHFLGTLYHFFWAKDFSFKKNVTGLVFKLIIVVAVGYLFEGLHELMVEAPFFRDYTIMSLRLTVFLYPAGSAFGNSYIMTNKKFPPMGFMERLKKYTKNLK